MEYIDRLRNLEILARHIVRHMDERAVMQVSSSMDLSIEFQDFFFAEIENRMKEMGFL